MMHTKLVNKLLYKMEIIIAQWQSDTAKTPM